MILWHMSSLTVFAVQISRRAKRMRCHCLLTMMKPQSLQVRHKTQDDAQIDTVIVVETNAHLSRATLWLVSACCVLVVSCTWKSIPFSGRPIYGPSRVITHCGVSWALAMSLKESYSNNFTWAVMQTTTVPKRCSSSSVIWTNYGWTCIIPRLLRLIWRVSLKSRSHTI
jgi:hypothetical protein